MSETLNAIDAVSHNSDQKAWEEDEVKEVISKVVACTGEQPFVKEIKSLNWDSIQIDGRDADECKHLILKAASKIRKHRTMAEILSEFTASLPDGLTRLGASRPISAYLIYYREQLKKMKKKHPDLSLLEMRKKIKKKWEQSEELKIKYQTQYKAMLDDYKRSRSQSVKSVKPVVPTPFRLYFADQISAMKAEQPGMNEKDLRALIKLNYDKLKDKKKIRLLRKASKKMDNYKAECEAFQKNNPKFKPKPYSLYPHLSKEEKRLLNDHCPKPTQVAKNQYVFYCSKTRPKLHGESFVEQNKILSASYHNLSSSEMADLKQEYINRLEKAISEMKNYTEMIKPWSSEIASTATDQVESYQKSLIRARKDDSRSPKAKKRKIAKISQDTTVKYGTSSDESESESEQNHAFHKLSPLKTPLKQEASSDSSDS